MEKSKLEGEKAQRGRDSEAEGWRHRQRETTMKDDEVKRASK